MTDKHLKHITDKEGSGIRNYRFSFGSDEKIFYTSFKGKLAQKDIHRILEILRRHRFEESSSVIRGYLEQNDSGYSDFLFWESAADPSRITDSVEALLHSDSGNIMGEFIGDADYCYSIIDCQKWIQEDDCRGCYYVAKQTTDKGIRHYRMIGQTFKCSSSGTESQGYFAIRSSREDGQLHTLDCVSGEPVLPAFGCIDLCGLLINIDNIRTVGQAVRTAIW